MIVCLPCQTPMLVGHSFYTAWIAQTKKEHPVEVASCPRCGCTVADVNRGIERHREGPSTSATTATRGTTATSAARRSSRSTAIEKKGTP